MTHESKRRAQKDIAAPTISPLLVSRRDVVIHQLPERLARTAEPVSDEIPILDLLIVVLCKFLV